MRGNQPRYAVLLLLLIVGVASSCFKNNGKTEDSVARVNESYLPKSELENLVPLATSPEDSLLIVKSYLDSWATKQLLLDAAAFNLSDEKKEEIQELVNNFKNDLLTTAYLDLLVRQKVDTVVQDSDLRAYYEQNKERLLTDDILVQLRYVNVMNGNTNLSKIKKYFMSSKKEDFSKLEDLSLQMKSYALNDTVWVNVNQIYDRLPFVTPENVSTYLSGNMFYEVQDSVSTYMVKVYKVLQKKSIAPYDYIKPTLEMMLLNNRKMELMKKLQKDILDDATKNKKYEVY